MDPEGTTILPPNADLSGEGVKRILWALKVTRGVTTGLIGLRLVEGVGEVDVHDVSDIMSVIVMIAKRFIGDNLFQSEINAIWRDYTTRFRVILASRWGFWRLT